MSVLRVLTDFSARWIHQAAWLCAVRSDSPADKPPGRLTGLSSFPCSDREAQRTFRLTIQRPLWGIHLWASRPSWFLYGAIRQKTKEEQNKFGVLFWMVLLHHAEKGDSKIIICGSRKAIIGHKDHSDPNSLPNLDFLHPCLQHPPLTF